MIRANLLHTLAACVFLSAAAGLAHGQSSPTAFTYQGRLVENGTPYNGAVDLVFTLYDTPTGGQGTVSTSVPNVSVVDGLFTTTVELGSFASSNPALTWLEIEVTDPISGNSTTLSPRQRLTPAPSASTIAGVQLQRADSQPFSTIPDSVDAWNAGWQSFISEGGYLTRIVWFDDRSSVGPGHPDPVFTIYEGRGTGGPVVASTRAVRVSFAFPLGEYRVTPLAPVLMRPGQEYTVGFQFASPTGTLRASAGGLPPGTDSSSGVAWAMQVTGERVSLGVDTAGSADWRSLINVPANVSGAFSPWRPGFERITYPLSVGVGEFVGGELPRAQMHVRRSATGVGPTGDSTMILENSGDNFLSFYSEVPDASGLLFVRGPSSVGAAITHNTPGAEGGFRFDTSGRVNAMILTTDAKLGVNVASPQFNIHVRSNTDTQLGLVSNARTWSVQSSSGDNGVGSPINGSFQIVDRTINAARVLIDTNGNMGVGVTSPTQRLHVAGNVLANNVTVPSSARFKENVTPLLGGLDALRVLEPVRFDWKPEHAKERAGRVHDIGFVAEDVAKLFPEVVFFDDTGAALGMDYGRLVTVAIRAAKEQDARVKALEEENEELRERLERLEAIVTPR